MAKGAATDFPNLTYVPPTRAEIQIIEESRKKAIKLLNSMPEFWKSILAGIPNEEELRVQLGSSELNPDTMRQDLEIMREETEAFFKSVDEKEKKAVETVEETIQIIEEKANRSIIIPVNQIDLFESTKSSALEEFLLRIASPLERICQRLEKWFENKRK